MNHFVENMNDFAAAWAPTLVAVLWQSTLLAALVAAACWALRRQSPRIRYALWLLLAAKLLVLPLWSVGVELPEQIAAVPTAPAPVNEAASFVPPPSSSTPNPSETTPATRSVPTAPASPPSPAVTWQSWLAALWLAVVLAEVARTAWQFHRLRRMLAAAQPAPPEIAALVAECAHKLELKSPPATRLIDGEGSPLVCGLLRPTLLLPAATLAAFDGAALRQIVLHELAHIRRRDLWTVWIILAMRTLYWFHPVAHWIAYRAGLERELACDELAMQHSGATPGAYARTLIRAVSATSQPLVVTAAVAARLNSGAPAVVGEAASFVRPIPKTNNAAASSH